MQARIWKTLAVVILGSAIVLIFGLATATAEDKPPLVGTWRVQVTQVDCTSGAALSPSFSSLLTFAAGGTMLEDTTNPAFGPGQRGDGQGVWSAKGEHTYSARTVTFIKYTTPADPTTHNPGFEAGQQTITQTISFTAGPNQWSSVAAITFTDATGAVYRQGCAVASATRF